MQYKLGKKPARPGAMKLKFADFVKKPKLPTPPKSFGHDAIVKDWGMLGNDQYGCCVFAGAAHETILWRKEADVDCLFTAEDVLKDYAAVTGFNPKEPWTDQGTDMTKAAEYRRGTGIIDSKGQRHTVGAFLALEPGDIKQHLQALWMFGAVGIGIEVPSNAMDQFDAGKPWDITPHTSIEGGHYIPLVAYRDMLHCVTWAKVQAMTDRFFKRYNDESVVYLSEEMLIKGKSPEGFDLPQLRDALSAL